MTAQMEDCIKYKNKNYAIVALSERFGFDPREYGVEPEYICTACWNGYWCDYKITKDGIHLDELFINTKDQKYPPINGVKVEDIEYIDCLSSRAGEEGLHKSKIEKYMGHRRYKELNIPIQYTGRMIIGEGFIDDYYVHMGYQEGWAYENLFEFEFIDGKLINQRNLSGLAKRMRDRVDSGEVEEPGGLSGITSLVERLFSREYEFKTKWIDELND